MLWHLICKKGGAVFPHPGSVTCPPGSPLGDGLTREAAADLGLDPGTAVGASLLIICYMIFTNSLIIQYKHSSCNSSEHVGSDCSFSVVIAEIHRLDLSDHVWSFMTASKLMWTKDVQSKFNFAPLFRLRPSSSSAFVVISTTHLRSFVTASCTAGCYCTDTICSDRQTDRQVDRQTDRQSDMHLAKCSKSLPS